MLIDRVLVCEAADCRSRRIRNIEIVVLKALRMDLPVIRIPIIALFAE